METASGRARNQFSVGPALLWLPAFVEAHAAAMLASELGVTVAPDGYSWPYRWACALTTASLGILGLLLARRLALPIVSPTAASIATLGVAFGSSHLVYAYALPFYAHVPAAFAVSLFLWSWRALPAPYTPARWAAWGAAGGLMVLVDPVTAAFLLIVDVEWIRQLRSTRDASGSLMGGGAFMLAALALLSPQLLLNALVHGSPLASGWFHRFFWDEPNLLAHAVGGGHGVFLWTPLTLVALAGLCGLALGRARSLALPVLAASILFYYVVASSDRWHAAPGFGNRFLIPLAPVWLLGLAAAIDALERGLAGRVHVAAWRWSALAAAVALAVVWNLGLIFQWGSGLVPRREAVDFRRVARQQFTLVPQSVVALARRALGGASTVQPPAAEATP
jgi:hypothetical protein